MLRGIVRAYQSYSRGAERFFAATLSNTYLAAGLVSLVLLSWGVVLGWPAYLEFWEGHGWNGLVYVRTKYSSCVTTAGSYAIFPSLLILIGLLIPPVVLARENGWWFFAPKKALRRKKAKRRLSDRFVSFMARRWDWFSPLASRFSRLFNWTGRFNWEIVCSRTVYLLLIGFSLFPVWRAAPVLLSQWDWNQTVNINWSNPQLLFPIWFAFLLSFWAILLCAFNIPSGKTNPARRILKGLVTRLFDRQSRHQVKEEQDAS